MSINNFESMINDESLKFTNETLNIMQVNITSKCNLSCKHCHISAGFGRTEEMSLETMKHVIRLLPNFKILDITGGAPEMNNNYRWLVDNAVKTGAHVMTRSNLVIMNESGYQDLPEFLAGRGVEIVCSLPFYSENDCDRQRGSGTFKIIISMLKKLNALGYGIDKRLPLDIVYNPGGAFLPPNQSSLEREYKARLKSEHNIEFTNLFAITNNPIGRFREFLDRSGNYDKYMKRLVDSFNPEALPGMMCRSQISVGCDGKLYDCDFNQPLGLALDEPDNISKVNDISQLTPRKIKFASHCYACTAGNGSSCGGTTA